MSRQTIFLAKVLPPFEVLECPEYITVKMKVAGDTLDIRVPIEKFYTPEDYLKHLEITALAVKDSIVLAKAENVEIVEEQIDLFSMKMQAKTLNMEE